MRTKRQHRCEACGHITTQWLGRCPSCGGWGTLAAEEIAASSPAAVRSGPPRVTALREVDARGDVRLQTGWGELDRVLGGGLVAGSVVLVGGEPGVGKSTLLLQVAHALAARGEPTLYVSGEESARQVRLRADRLGLLDSALGIVTETDLEAIEEAVVQAQPRLAVVDSIQTTRAPGVDSLPGSVAQVRECTGRLTELSKRTGTATMLVGHVTKDGTLAGPKVTEHVVDAVLMFEGDRSQALKVLRATKNRYGSTNEVGLFDMTDAGLVEVDNPSSLLLDQRASEVEGTVACCTLEGSRPLILEVQALVAPSPFAAPRRVATGLDANRLHLLLAVIEQHAGIRVSQQDVYTNVVSGVRLTEPAADLAVAMAVMSSALLIPLPSDTIVFGEVGLTGEVRAVSQTDRRLDEALRLGFGLAVAPRQKTPRERGPAVREIRSIREAAAWLRDAGREAG
ncbi:MAG: DNA repair protein RadA [Armatimonadetes bacterium]|nr:DNA repair protein RadA [Armatimonadota bacterium]